MNEYEVEVTIKLFVRVFADSANEAHKTASCITIGELYDEFEYEYDSVIAGSVVKKGDA